MESITVTFNYAPTLLPADVDPKTSEGKALIKEAMVEAMLRAPYHGVPQEPHNTIMRAFTAEEAKNVAPPIGPVSFAKAVAGACYKLRGFGPTPPKEVCKDVFAMLSRHNKTYVRGFAEAKDPRDVARQIQHAEWDLQRGQA